MIGKIFSFLFGMYTGVLIVCFLAAIIFSFILKRKSKNLEIRAISLDSYKIYKKGKDLKTAVFPSLINEVKEVAKLTNPSSPNPLVDLSVNEIIKGLFLVQSYLKLLVDNPLFKDLRKLTLKQILNVEKVVKKPLAILNNKYVKKLMFIYNKLILVFYILSPTTWVRRILMHTLFKEGKKDIIIACFDVLGNTVTKIYTHDDVADNTIEDQQV